MTYVVKSGRFALSWSTTVSVGSPRGGPWTATETTLIVGVSGRTVALWTPGMLVTDAVTQGWTYAYSAGCTCMTYSGGPYTLR